VETSARRDGEAFVLDGRKGVVLGGDSADRLIVSARTAGGRRDRDGIGLFLVDGKAPGIFRQGYPTQDGMRAAEITFENVRAEALGDPGGALPIIERVADETRAAMCAEAIGAMAKSVDLTVEYIKTRKQFGVAIGAFQALQHRAADMVVALEQARSMSYYATMMAVAEDPAERERAVAGAKIQIGRSARYVGEQSVQLHGGVGVTMEYNIGHYFKRLTAIDRTLGDADYHLERLAEAGGLYRAA
jgi:alkylation response protein AidB-like acyl-CoA dehydrogenase